jgi:hypothetical protein
MVPHISSANCLFIVLSMYQNEIIFKHVFEYIKRSERFLVV